MPPEFLNYNSILHEFIIPNLAHIIIGYISHYKDIFDKVFILECIKTGDYLYYNKDNTTLLHYLFQYGRRNDIEVLLKNSNYSRAEHFQNKNKDGETELYLLCYYKMHSTIALVKNWKPEHFQNKNEDGGTELHKLCHNKMHSTIALVKNWKPEHFQNKNEDGETELRVLCENRMHLTIELVGLNFVNGGNEPCTFWKLKHFQNKNIYGQTELHSLCHNKMHSTIVLIRERKPEHFQNKDRSGCTELYWLCYYKMHLTIVLAICNFVDGDNKDKAIDNVLCTFWKPKHFQNKDKCGQTELYWLCLNGMHSSIALIKDLRAVHF